MPSTEKRQAEEFAEGGASARGWGAVSGSASSGVAASREPAAAGRPACARCPLGSSAGTARWGIDADDQDYVVALAGSPNTGKSTVFNAVTGLRQHTGNWPGKTVTRAEGRFDVDGNRFKLVDLPGIYSMLTPRAEERIAHDFLLFGRPDVTVVVVDATQLERNLSFVLQVLELAGPVVVCLNLVDQARRQGIDVDAEALARELGVPVVPTVARYGDGIDELVRTIDEVAAGERPLTPVRFAGPNSNVRAAVREITERVRTAYPDLDAPRWIALRLLDGDAGVEAAIRSGWYGRFTAAEAADGNGGPDTGNGSGRASLGLDPAGDSLLQQAATVRRSVGADLHDRIVEALYDQAAGIAERVVARRQPEGRDWDLTVDRLVTSRRYGFPLMLLLLTVVFWITVAGANYPSRMLAWLLLDTVHPALKGVAGAVGMPWWLDGLLIDGVYLATAWVVSVMLPPMAIFFPLFTLLEDAGYLARVAFNLDHVFQRVGAHGKQALSMSMGFGCNAAGVIATRIIDSPRERLIAILTNNFALCNGRWPTQILIAAVFIGGLVPPYLAGLVSAAAVVGVAVLGVALTFLVSLLLSRTVLRGEASTFSLELPPYRPPKIFRTLYTSLIDRTIYVLWRAVVFAVPAGAAIWLSANLGWGGRSVAEHLIGWLDPLGFWIGLNGVILLAYVLAIPANEIVIPTILMLTVLAAGLGGLGEGAGVMFEAESGATVAEILVGGGGWTLLTAVNLMLFSLIHNPCSTTLYTIYKETGSARWTAVAALLPVGLGLAVCTAVAWAWRLLL